MAVPKRKTSKSRQQMRKRSHKTKLAGTHSCAQCGAAKEPHRVCPSCGFYRGRQVLTVSSED